MLQDKFTGRQTPFTDLLQGSRPVLLDGGLATQLEAQGCDLANELWSALMLRSDPAAIVAAHQAFIEAGAQCIATASYQASREGFAGIGLDAQQADDLIRHAVSLAKQAREKTASSVAIAASIGPYGAMLHDGSEYRGDYHVSEETLRTFHDNRLAVLDAELVDVLAVETVPCYREAAVLAELLAECETPSWVSFSCRAATLISDGTPIARAAALFADHPRVVAIGVNCTPPQYVPPLLEILCLSAPDKCLIAYPNSGENYDVSNNSWHGTVTPGDVGDAAMSWLAAGAKAVGGCCRVGPQHIAAIREKLRDLT